MHNNDRFSNVPKDILELILYKTNPKDLDTFCSINERINNLCQNNQILDKYIKYHQLVSNNFEDTLNFIIDTNSIILIAYLLESLINSNELLYMYHWGIIERLTTDKNILDQDVFNLGSLIYSKFKMSRDQQKIKNTLTYWALTNDRKQLIQLLKNNNLFEYYQSMDTSYMLENVEEFMESINYMIEHNLHKEYGLDDMILNIIHNIIHIPNQRIVEFLLSIEDPKFKSALDKNLPILSDTIHSNLRRGYQSEYKDKYQAILDLLV